MIRKLGKILRFALDDEGKILRFALDDEEDNYHLQESLGSGISWVVLDAILRIAENG